MGIMDMLLNFMLESHSAIKNDSLLQNTVKWENFGWLSGYINIKKRSFMSKSSLWRWRLNAYVYIRSWYGVKFVITLDLLCVKKETWREGRGLVRRKNKLSKKLWIISFQNAIRDSSFQNILESKLLQFFLLI